MLHKISFACSPIDKYRIENQFLESNLDTDRNRKSPINRRKKIIPTPQNENYVLWTLRHPSLALCLIKRHHMVGDAVIISHVVASLLLLHLLLKFIIFIRVGDDKATLDYLKSVYYPHLAHYSPKPHNFNSSLLGFVILYICFRIRNVCRLIEQSIINAHSYQELHVPQLTLAYMSTFNFTPSQWLEFWKHASNHRRAIKNDAEKYKDHLKFNQQIHSQVLDIQHSKYTIYYYNSIDFEECYADLEFMRRPERQSKNERAWHTAYPIDRQSLSDLQYIVPITLMVSFSVFFGLLICLMMMLYRDLGTDYPEEYSPSLLDYIRNAPTFFSSIAHIIKILELNFFYACIIPQIYESIKVATDVFVTDSRANKVIDIFHEHLKYCREREQDLFKIIKAKELITEQNMFSHYQRAITELNSNFRLLNKRISQDINLTKSIYTEFLNVREYHSTFLNLLILGSGVCIPLIVSNAIYVIEWPELTVMSLSLISCTVPMLVNLLFCARIENTVSVKFGF